MRPPQTMPSQAGPPAICHLRTMPSQSHPSRCSSQTDNRRLHCQTPLATTLYLSHYTQITLLGLLSSLQYTLLISGFYKLLWGWLQISFHYIYIYILYISYIYICKYDFSSLQRFGTHLHTLKTHTHTHYL